MAYNCGLHWHPTRELAEKCERKREDERLYGKSKLVESSELSKETPSK